MADYLILRRVMPDKGVMNARLAVWMNTIAVIAELFLIPLLFMFF
jgi:hypothetical protein